MLSSLKTLLAGVIDYAGLFPPAQLPLANAFDYYLGYRQCPDARMLGRFVIPAARLGELTEFADRIRAEHSPLSFAILCRQAKRWDDFAGALRSDLNELMAFRERFQGKVVTDVLELRLPDEDVAGQGQVMFLLDAIDSVKEIGLRHWSLFVEGPATAPSEEMDAHTIAVQKDIGKVAAGRRSGLQAAGFKLRCGGTATSPVPSRERLAKVLIECKRNAVPLKLTAGLHHPLASAGGEPRHGFMNVLVAAVLISQAELPFARLVELLGVCEAGHFHFSDDALGWQEYRARLADIPAGRELLQAFGSCSFDEPRQDLRELGWF